MTETTNQAPTEDIREALKDVIDPELGVNVVDLGLLYGLHYADDGALLVDMTLTTAACPLTDEIEDQVFGVDQAPPTERIYKLKREVMAFRRAVDPLTAVTGALSGGQVRCLDPSTADYFRDVHDHLLRAGDAIEGHDKLLTDVLQADLSRVAARQSAIALRQNEISVRQNEDMRKISAWAAIALVPTAVAGIYGMNFQHMPELHWRYGYFLALGVIAGACFALYRLFRRNGWL